ncbi:MAG: hypothetical protein AAF991_11160 [Pseudomonadota bacterium]
MTEPWMGHPKLVAWFDDLEDAVTTAFALTDEQRASVKALKAPRAATWVMMAVSPEARDVLRTRLRDVQSSTPLPVASDCKVLLAQGEFRAQTDRFDQENGFGSVDVEYIEEGSAEAIRRELLADSDEYAASSDTGWFYSCSDQDSEDDIIWNGDDQGELE